MSVDMQIGRVTGWRHYLSVGIGSAMLVWFAYVMIEFPDAPIHECREHGYCGKQGRPHTETEFDHFNVWQTGLMYVWPTGMLGVFILRRQQFRWRK